MTVAVAMLAVGLAMGLAAVLVHERRLARRLLRAGHQLAPEVVPTGAGLAEATSVLERVAERSELRSSHEALAAARLAAALARIPQGVVVFDARGEIAFRNRVAARYLEARHTDALIDEAIKDLAGRALDPLGVARPSRTVELFGPPRRTLVLEAISLERAGDELGALVVIDDVSERRRLEAIRRDFVANISHELKTPVAALGLLAETLGAEDEPSVARRLALRMQDEAFRVARTIDDLLELSRIEVDPELERAPLVLAPVVAEAVERVREAAEQQGVLIDVDPPPQELWVVGDRRQLASAVYNLLDNAVKYSDRGSTVHVHLEREDRWVVVTVVDEGIGIPRRDLERVFERFYRVDRGRSRDTGGTGLGLAIVRHVADNHHGEVHVDSVEGTGSAFSLRLPPHAGDAPDARA